VLQCSPPRSAHHLMPTRTPPLLRALRLAFALLTLAAIGWQLVLHLRAGHDPVNFFSYFTNLSNLLAALVLLAAASSLAFTQQPGFDLLRGAAAVQMALVGLVFGALLRDADLGDLRPWVNTVVHMVMPVVVVADWLLAPPRSRLRPRHLAAVLVFPALYLAYTLTRGALVGWYPYPFLNPARVGGPGGVALYAAGITLGFVVVGGLLFALGNRLRR
jgi:hypothetical protein